MKPRFRTLGSRRVVEIDVYGEFMEVAFFQGDLLDSVVHWPAGEILWMEPLDDAARAMQAEYAIEHGARQ